MESVGGQPLDPAAGTLDPLAGRARSSSWRAAVADGWRLARPTLAEAFTPRRIRVMLVSSSVLGIVVSAVLDVVLMRLFEPWRSVLFALGGGLLASVVLASILPYRWRSSVGTAPVGTAPVGTAAGSAAGTGSGAAPRRRSPAPQKDGDAMEIRRAWLEGSEPGILVDRRLAAADQAEGYRAFAPLILVTQLAPAGTILPFALFGVALLPRFVLFVALIGAANAVVGVLSTLAALGRTRAAIETRPAVPEHLEPNGAKKPRPLRSLGTDHPDDWT